ncbi:MAG TPA: Smr/MutS family protein, partial [Saprospiraceae bacterium]|nr:Smr/MutS family protein [Saprospiraceae bacterium]
GGAIAESILNEIAKSGAKAILTTHYSNLKTYTNHTPGMVNGAMLYDEAHMEPRYELQVGKPGSSYALDIAKKLRFPRQVIQYARSRAGKGLVRMEDLIAKLEEEKSTLEEKNKEYLKKLDALNRLIKAYQDTHDQFTLKKMKFKLEQKQFEYEKTLKTKEQHNALSREIREKLDIVQARKLESESQQKANYLAQEMQQLQKNYTDLVRKDLVIRPVRVGDKVRLIQHNLTGIVSEIQDEEAKVITENFTIKVKKSDLIPLQESMIVPKEKKVQLQLLEKTAAFTSTLDVRGLLPMDAVESLENYLDQALLTNVKEIKIIHGKGTGALRLAIQKVLKKNKYVGQISHPEEQEGGSGITLVQFK